MQKQLKTDALYRRGISIIGFIVLLALVPLIAWSLNFMVSRDFAESNTPKYLAAESASLQTQKIISTPIVDISTSTISITTLATSTPKVPATSNTIATSSSKITATQIVTLTDTGFSPAKITVTRGDAITFVNKSSGKMWVASNPFPSSSEYPTFNEKEGVDNGESWTFTFDQAGTWFYHNHYSPATGAKVVVSWK